MENYQLNKSEVVLFRSDVTLSQGGKKNKGKVKTEVLLTNENFVFINKTKKLFKKEAVDTLVVSIESMKIYKELPYLIRKEVLIEIYTLADEYFLEFENKKQAKEFFDKAMRVASGYSKFVRGVKKVRKEIKETNEALDIDIVNATQKTLAFAADVAIDCAECFPESKKLKLMGTVAKVFKKRNRQDGLQLESKNAELPASVKTEAEEN